MSALPQAERLVLFAHGRESGPWGSKITRLAEVARTQGFEVASPDYSAWKDPEPRVEHLLELQPKAQTLILVGSSLGAWVSLKASASLKPQGLFLLAPAVQLGVFSEDAPAPQADRTEVIHGWDDDVVPASNALRFCEEHRLPLHLLPSGHRLTDQLETLAYLFAQFLQGFPASAAADPRSAWELEQEANFQRKTFENEKPRIPR